MDQDQDDPFDWSVDQVVQYLCRNGSSPWSVSKNPSPLPDQKPLEAALREHGITGEVLLNGHLEDFLRNSLKLKEGPYYTVNKAIQYAQRLSVKYQALQNQERSQFASTMLPMMSNDRAWAHPFNPAWIYNYTPASFHPSQPTSLPNPSIAENEGDRLPNEQLLANLHAVQIPSSPRIAEVDDVELRDAPAESGDGNAGQPFQVASPILRPNEAIHVDEHGRKRRRLNLSSVESQVSRIPESKQKPTETPARASPRSWYMGPDKMDVANIFYPIQADSKGDDWSFSFSQHALGQRLFVKRKMLRFFRKQAIDMPSPKGTRRFAVFPYDEDEVNRGKPRYYTLYTSHKGTTEVSMKSTADPDCQIADQSSRVQTASPYDYLLQKYPVEEDGNSYPVFGDSGSEGEYDSDTWREIEEERRQATARGPRFLSAHEVDSTIDQCIKNYEEKWRAKHLPKLELEAHKLWIDAIGNKCRNARIKIMLDGIERLNLRLRKIRKELHGHEWTQRDHLEHQCESLERTVFELEDQKRRIAILELPRCPPKPSLEHRLAAKPRKRIIRTPPEEESVGSDSDDSLADFIEDDMDLDIDGGPSTDVAPNDEHHDETQAAFDVPSTTTDSNTLSDSNGPQDQRKSAPPRSARKDISNKEIVIEDHSDSENAISQRRCGFYYSSGSDSEGYSPQPTLNGVGKQVVIIDLTESPRSKSDLPLNIGMRPLKNKSGTPAIDDKVSVVIPSSQKSKSSLKSDVKRDPELGNTHSGKYNDTKKDDFPPVRRPSRIEFLEKMIKGLDEKTRSALNDRLSSYSERRLKQVVKGALRALDKDKRHVPGMNHDESDLVMRTTVLYIAWVNLRRFNKSGIAKIAVKKSIENIENPEPGSDVNFTEYVSQLFQLLDQYNPKASNSSTGDSDDEGPLSSRSPHKKKRRLKEDQAVKSGQVAAKQRVEHQEQQRKMLEQRLERVGVSNSDPEHQAVSFEQPTIFLHPHIGRRVKPHQLSGIQFMWRELIQNDKRDGCLLAHTMGLGKTMQVISLLVTIAAAANSANPAIRKQVPEYFHRSQTLILCPPSLIDNWYEEFLMWTPKEHALGPIRKIAPSDHPSTRISTVEQWHTDGGILILSYHLFRNWVEQKTRKNQRYVPEAQVLPQLRDYLLKDPRIIVADEAHQMKNKDSILAQAASLLESKSRIALTGSPLANNLIDYYAMVNWISPKYLDEIAVFRDKYLEPIEQGLFADSTYFEQRKSLKKLQILKEILNPKIHRADISVLEGSLPMKVEFVITVPLTEVQKKAYNQYASSLLEAKSGESSVLSTTLMAWLAVLGLCCNHPACFYDKLAKKAEELAPKTTSEELADQETFPGEVPLSSLGFSESMWAPQKELLSAVPDLDHPRHSHRAEIFRRIVEESVRVGDKILCFSQSIPTLNYLERLLQSYGVKFNRLDGSTAVRTRQAAIKEFNSRDDIKVYLISTRAGGLGLNITGANRVIIFDFGFNPTWEEQAVGRAYRLGQKKPVYIYRFLSAGTFEEIIHNKSIFKTQLAMRVVDKKNVQRSASKSLGEYLFPVKDVKKEDISDFIGRDRDVLDKILLADDPSSPTILKIALTETFRREHNEMLTEDEKKEMEQELEMELLRMSNPAAYERKLYEARSVYPSTNPTINNNYNNYNGAYGTYSMPMATPTSTQPDRAFFRPPAWAGANSSSVHSANPTASSFVSGSNVPSPSPFSQPTFKIPNKQAPMHPDITSTPSSNSRNNLQDPEIIAEAYLKSITTPRTFNSNSRGHSPNLPPRPSSETGQSLKSVVTTPTANNNHNPNLPPRPPPLPSETAGANGLPGPVSAEALTTHLGDNERTLQTHLSHNLTTS